MEGKDLERVQVYAQKVMRFISTNEDLDAPIVAPSVYIRLLQLLKGPLLPSICDLRLSSSSSVLPYISTFLSTSLRSVEMDITFSTHSQILEPFFNMLPFDAPSLERLVLRGPDKLPSVSLEFISYCVNLRCLELSDVVGIKDWSLVKCIGSLPNLEELIVVSRNLEYRSDEMILDAGGFYNLQKLSITAPLLLIRDLVQFIASTLHDALLTPIMDLSLLFMPPAKFPDPPDATTGPLISAPNHAKPSKGDKVMPTSISKTKSIGKSGTEATLGGKATKAKKIEEKCRDPSPEAEAVFKSLPSEQVASPLITDNVAKPSSSMWLVFLQQIFRVMTVRWGNSLQSLTFSLQDTSNPMLIPDESHILELPLDLILSWRQFRNLQTLDARFWKFASLDHALVELASSWPHLQVLRLPLAPYSSTINLSSLRLLALYCPDLNTIQASINDAGLEILPVHCTAGYALRHKLATLSVGSVFPPQQPLGISRYINILFPYLKTLETHEGLNEQQWRQIYDLIRLCQSATEDDRNRM